MKAYALIATLAVALIAGTSQAPVAVAAPTSTVAYEQHISGLGTVTYVFTGHQATYFGNIFGKALNGTRVSYVRGSLCAVWYQPKVKLTLGMYATSRTLGNVMASSLASSARKAGFVRIK